MTFYAKIYFGEKSPGILSGTQIADIVEISFEQDNLSKAVDMFKTEEPLVISMGEYGFKVLHMRNVNWVEVFTQEQWDNIKLKTGSKEHNDADDKNSKKQRDFTNIFNDLLGVR